MTTPAGDESGCSSSVVGGAGAVVVDVVVSQSTVADTLSSATDADVTQPGVDVVDVVSAVVVGWEIGGSDAGAPPMVVLVTIESGFGVGSPGATVVSGC